MSAVVDSASASRSCGDLVGRSDAPSDNNVVAASARWSEYLMASASGPGSARRSAPVGLAGLSRHPGALAVTLFAARSGEHGALNSGGQLSSEVNVERNMTDHLSCSRRVANL
jgi:hypothetical protein